MIQWGKKRWERRREDGDGEGMVGSEWMECVRMGWDRVEEVNGKSDRINHH